MASISSCSPRLLKSRGKYREQSERGLYWEPLVKQCLSKKGRFRGQRCKAHFRLKPVIFDSVHNFLAPNHNLGLLTHFFLTALSKLRRLLHLRQALKTSVLICIASKVHISFFLSRLCAAHTHWPSFSMFFLPLTILRTIRHGTEINLEHKSTRNINRPI